ncbi:hypothetical protein TRICI_000016 [Trichomonascus ciferrii]|uniref:Uncharacterized protein n=1 Tax=Trichomonascus ciferrii TaxID=44093 RepID=A0A642VEK0_9ASCO|nr:hypothetical protein TRICI_000016 [Trichomonascus ciferrii]
MNKDTSESDDSTIEHYSGGTSFDENSQLLSGGNKVGPTDTEHSTSEVASDNHDWQSFNAAVTGHKVGPVDLDKSDSQTSTKTKQ